MSIVINFANDINNSFLQDFKTIEVGLINTRDPKYDYISSNMGNARYRTTQNLRIFVLVLLPLGEGVLSSCLRLSVRPSF